MNDDDWDQWVAYHSTLHRWTADEDLMMLGVWREEFDARAFTLEEMKAASMSIAKNHSKAWGREHLDLLLAAVGFARFAKAQKIHTQAIAARGYKVCTICDNHGHVIVPHPKCLTEGEWVHPYYTGIVACPCSQGIVRKRWQDAAIEATIEANKKKGKNATMVPPPLMTLEEYERLNADWLNQFRRRINEDRRLARIKAETAKIDKQDVALVFAQIVDKLPERKAIAPPKPEPKHITVSPEEATCPF